MLDSPWVDTPWKKAAAEEKAAEERAKSKAVKPTDAAEAQTSASSKDEGKSTEDEAEVIIPDELPEDALFIPLGVVRQKPQTFYKGTDPEWQSFVNFSKDRKRAQFLRSMY